MRTLLSRLSAVLAISLTLSVTPLISGEIAGAASQGACTTWVKMIDISSNQPHPINWAKVVKSGVAGVYVKATENTTYTNPYFSKDAAQAVANGIPYGGYDFARPDKSDPIADAKYFVAAGGADGQLPPALDLETLGKTTIDTLRWAFAWLNEVSTLTGTYPIIYTGSYYPWSSNASLGSWKLWLAAYPHGYQPTQSACKLPLPVVSAPWVRQGWSIWQYSSRGFVPGIFYSVDLDAATTAWFQYVTNADVSAPTSNGSVVPIYAYGSKGTAVTYIQRTLYGLGLLPYVEITGIFDIFTVNALKKYQALMGIPANCQWDSASVAANIWYKANHRPVENTTNYPTLALKSAGAKVVWVQQRLNSARFYTPVTGIYTKETRNEVAQFQKAHHLPASGVVNLATWRVLWSA